MASRSRRIVRPCRLVLWQYSRAMSPVTHFLTGWVFANTAKLNRRDRALVTLAGVIPDVDGLGIIAELLTRNTTHPLDWFSRYHHSLHNLGFALFVAIAAYAFATPR